MFSYSTADAGQARSTARKASSGRSSSASSVLTVLTRFRYCCAPTMVGFASTRSSNWAMAIRFSMRFFSAAVITTLLEVRHGRHGPPLHLTSGRRGSNQGPRSLAPAVLERGDAIEHRLRERVIDAIGHEVAMAFELHARLGVELAGGRLDV